jgi:hypothetical protein
MPLLTENQVRDAARQRTTVLRKSADSILREHARANSASGGPFDIFLSHSFADQDIVLGAVAILERFNFTVYVDWIVDDLKRERVTPAHAVILRARMRQSNALLYLKTEHSSDSTWMPWELGYFDAFRGRVGILPVTQKVRSDYEGNEYLGLYPYVDLAAVEGGPERLWINRSTNEYGQLREWLTNTAAIRKRVA